MPQSLKFIRSFLLLACATVAIVVPGIFVSNHIRTEQLSRDILHQYARALFDEVILTRQWVAEHGGAYVRVKPGVAPNPFLTMVPGLKVNIADQDGHLYTLRNPGLVVSGISQLAEKSGRFRLHAASLNPLNPRNNSPDPFERAALLSFEQGATEAAAVEETPTGQVYRYMAPLLCEAECTNCHRQQNSRPGEIRGGISVTIPMHFVNEKLAENQRFAILSALLVFGLLATFLYIQSQRCLDRVRDAQAQLMEMATRDSLTGLLNRRTVYERLAGEIAKHRRFATPLSCLLLDLDNFKEINDSHGHLAGDAVLAAVAAMLKDSSRQYDILSRYGGEEFLLLLPGSDLAAAALAGEKLRQQLAGLAIPFEGKQLRVTVSIGAAQLSNLDQEADALIGRADAALYLAKRAGKDRVVTHPA